MSIYSVYSSCKMDLVYTSMAKSVVSHKTGIPLDVELKVHLNMYVHLHE